MTNLLASLIILSTVSWTNEVKLYKEVPDPYSARVQEVEQWTWTGDHEAHGGGGSITTPVGGFVPHKTNIVVFERYDYYETNAVKEVVTKWVLQMKR